MKPLLFLVGIFFMNFLARIILSPLMPTVEKDLKIGHAEAGSLFFLISFGYCLGLLISSFVSSRLKHRTTILLSSLGVGLTLILAGVSRELWWIRSILFLMGVAAGFYLPSGIATLTGLVNPRHWGKAIAIHELAPNLGFIFAPLLTEALLGWRSWQGILMVIGIASFVMGGVFLLRGEGGDFPGEAPNWGMVRNISQEPSLWMMMIFFSLGIGSSFGVYSMMPLYLVSERGMERSWANTLIGLSRVLTLATAFVAGWLTDRLGVKRTLKMVFLLSGLAIALFGIVPGSWVIWIIFLQPILTTSFFPPAFAALTRISSPHFKNVAISLTAPVGFIIGGGAVTAGLGVMGEAGLFSLGFILYGGLLLIGAGLVRYLKFTNDHG
ncbi:MAG: protein NarK [Deltaproteobacteria bacterium RBG_16_49_23]|nr:MAG: protein NarK [Deltaproteobacteria bacterium RBG_16_49_23]